MPEGDTVWRTARRLHLGLAGQRLTLSDLRWPAVATLDLTGATTLEVVARGKHILHRLDSGLTLHTHLRMDGSWRLLRQRGQLPADTRRHTVRALLGTREWLAVGDSLGMLDVVPTARESTLVGHLGPDILGPDWDMATALANLRSRPERAVGAALLDQRNLAGIGTMYDAEALFATRQAPWQPVGEIDDARLESIVTTARRMLVQNCARARAVTTGVDRDGERTWAHARSGRPCRRCGGTMRVAMIGDPPQDRTMFYCPACQGGLGPTDDGRPQAPLGSRPRSV